MVTGNPHIPNIENTPEVGTQLSSGPARPLILFPVRLETRFFQQADGSFELRVRVYPDKVHIDSHEPDLTADELTWGKHFWEETWRAAKDEERRKAAWRQLADRLDPQRAAWVARTLKPLNPDDRPKNAIDSTDPLPNPVRFPSHAPKAEAWTRAPYTRMLPNFWIVLGYKDGRLVINAKGGLITDPLATGPDPSPSAKVDQTGIDEGMKWMVDYEAAEKNGMAVRAALSEADAAAGLDFLLVLGIKDSPDVTTDWTAHLAELLNAHHYADGLSFIPQGTPSNNTQDAPSGFTSSDPGHEASYLAEGTEQASQTTNGSNADLLTQAFGLAKAGPVFANLPNATTSEQLDARQMNTALWQATWGYFLQQMLGADPTTVRPLKDEDIAWARSHFIDYVRAGGPLPALRIGKQPYAILPVTSLTAWKRPMGQEGEFSRDEVLQRLLIRLREIWRRNFQEVPRLGRSEDVDGTGLEKDLAEVLSMDALSSSYSIRQLLGRHYLDNLLVFLSADFFLDVWEAELPEIPPEEEPPEIEDPPEDLLPRLRIQWLRQQQAMRLAFIRQQEASRRNAMRAREAMLSRIGGKRASLPEWWAAQERLIGSVLNELGLSWRPRMARAVFSTPVATLNGALVQADEGLALSPNYIESLLAARDLTKEVWFHGQALEQPPPHTLLHLLLRHSMLLEYVSAASALLKLTPELQREPELLNLQAGQSTQTIWEQMKTNINVTGVATPVAVGQYLLNFTPSGEPDVTREPRLKPLSEFRAGLAHLKSLDVARLEQLMTSTLDLCSHRLDAWITSFATKRLAELRKSDPTGVLIGGYGWVMNLKPAEGQTQAPTPASEQGPVFQSTRNPGFIHTPSLTQASAVAILRSGHLAHSSGNQTPDDLLAIDLSSERVRLATWLLDGVRQGQPLGALLGYRFERRLQEVRKAQFISVFRELAPLVARKLESGTQPVTESVEAIAANNVVDGLGLLRRWQKGNEAQPPQWTTDTIPFDQRVNQETIALPPFDLNNADFKAIRDELLMLEDAVDSVGDALLAESVYQVVRGNPLRAASTVDSIAGGETPPPELEVVRTPRTGIALTHRMVTLFSGAAKLPRHWSATANAFRAEAEPHLNAWAARLLPNPANVRCIVESLDPATEKVLDTKEIRLEELRLAPLDYIYAIEGGKGGQQAEIEQRILFAMMRQPDGFPPGSLLRVNTMRKPEWKINELSYGEFSESLRTARKLLTSVRAIDDDDLNPPDRTTDFSVDVSNLDRRTSRAEESLRKTARDFQTQFSTSDPAILEMLRELIVRSSAFGVAGAVPLSAVGDLPFDREVLLIQAGSIHKELSQRVEQLDALAERFDANVATIEDKQKHALTRLQLVFGKAFIVLPRFKATNVEELEKALADSDKVQGGDPLASVTWFQRMARVRDGVARLSFALNYSEALGTGEKLELKIAQLPYDEDDRWVGLPLEAGKSLPGGKLSLAVQFAGKVDVRKPLAGVLIDEWVEVVPSTTETTGIALQYDQPNAAPPQTILIAVPPEIESPWTIWSLQQVLLETLDLARIRAVDPVTLDEVGHYLPALYFAYNTLGDTVSTDFTTIK